MSEPQETSRTTIDSESSEAKDRTRDQDSLRSWLALLVVVCAAAIAAFGGIFLTRPPEAVTADATDPQRFSASRAESYLRLLAGDEIPHPAGSAQNRVIQQRLIESLRAMGYEVEVQETSHPLLYRRESTDPEEIPLTNIMVRLEGRRHDDAVMLVAHHDSVPYGPGAADDAAGVAALMEIARMMQANDRQPERDVIFLITDGEEYGLLGARRFVEQHPWAKQVQRVINLEARGTSGPSCMFETGPNNIGLIRIFANSVKRPVSSSLFYDIYRSMPNDTDFTIFKRAGMNGFNFAFIGDVQNYHTPNDDLAHLSRRSLQHHGDNASELMAALAYNSELKPVTGDAVWFDFFGRVLIWWPAVWGWLPIGCAFILGMAIAASWIRSSGPSFGTIAIDAAKPLIAMFAITAMAIGFEWLLRTQERLDSAWPENGRHYLLAIWMVGTATAVALAMLSQRFGVRSDHVSNRAVDAPWSYWFWWLVMSIAVMVWLPGGSYLWLVPLSAILIGSILDRAMGDHRFTIASALFAMTALMVWIPVEPLFYDAIGFRFPGASGVRVALVTTTAIPVVQRAPAIARGVLFITALIASLVLALA